jgi:hypothetical protein
VAGKADATATDRKAKLKRIVLFTLAALSLIIAHKRPSKVFLSPSPYIRTNERSADAKKLEISEEIILTSGEMCVFHHVTANKQRRDFLSCSLDGFGHLPPQLPGHVSAPLSQAGSGG